MMKAGFVTTVTKDIACQTKHCNNSTLGIYMGSHAVLSIESAPQSTACAVAHAHDDAHMHTPVDFVIAAGVAGERVWLSPAELPSEQSHLAGKIRTLRRRA